MSLYVIDIKLVTYDFNKQTTTVVEAPSVEEAVGYAIELEAHGDIETTEDGGWADSSVGVTYYIETAAEVPPHHEAAIRELFTVWGA